MNEQSTAHPPLQVDPVLLQKRKFWRRMITFSIYGIVIPPTIGLVGTVISMIRAFNTTSSQGEPADPTVLAGDIHGSLHAISTGLSVSCVALMVLLVSFSRYCKLPKPPRPLPSSPRA